MPVAGAHAAVPGVFVGRSEQVAELLEWLNPGGSQGAAVSGVVGLPGVGKTALARHAAGQAVERGWFAGGAVMVDLHGYDPKGRIEPAQVFGPLLRALGVPDGQVPAAAGEQAATYHQLLATAAERHRPVLLLLDNVSGQRQIAELLPVHRMHRVLITSRHSLDDPVSALLELGILSPDEAVSLVSQVLRRRHQGDHRVAEWPEQAAVLAELCGRLPLALRIAAALLSDDPGLTVPELVTDLADPPARLAGLAHGDIAVAAAFDLSWRHLSGRDEQAARLLRLMTVNPGADISTEAAAVVAGQSEGDVRRQLRALRHAHLIEPGTAPRRWSMHDLIRLYADELSSAHADEDDRDAALGLLLDFYREMTSDAGAWVSSRAGSQPMASRFGSRGQAMAWLDSEQANLIPAARAARQVGRWRHVTALAQNLQQYLELRHFIEEWTGLARLAVGAARHIGPAQEAAAVSNLGCALRVARLFDGSVSCLKHARDLAAAHGDRHGEGTVLHNLGLTYFQMGKYAEAEECHRRDLAICMAVGDRHGAATSMVALGDTLRKLEQFTGAIEMFTRAAAELRDCGDTRGVMNAQANLALTWLDWRPDGKERAGYVIWLLCQSLKAARDLDDGYAQAVAFLNLGEAYLSRCQACHPQASRDCSRRAAEMFRSLGDRFLEANALLNLGKVEAALGEAVAARSHLRQGADIFGSLGESEREERGRELLEHMSTLVLNPECQHQSQAEIEYREWLGDLPDSVLRDEDARLDEYLFDGTTVFPQVVVDLAQEALRHREHSVPGQPEEDASARASAAVSLESVAAGSRPVVLLLEVLAVTDPEGVDRGFLYAAGAPESRQAIDEAITTLESASLIQCEAGGNIVAAGPLVHRAIRDHVIQQERVSGAAAHVAIVLRAEFPVRITPAAGTGHMLRFSRQIDAVWAAMRPALEGGEREGLAEIMQLRGWQVVQGTMILSRGAHEAAVSAAADVIINLATAVLDDCERLLGLHHAETLRAANNLAGAYGQAGRYDQACALLAQVLRSVGPVAQPDPEILFIRHNLGFMQLKAGRPKRALHIFREVLADRERILGSDHPDTRETRQLLEMAEEERQAHN
jgi:tetratricopeptide (TPR) repeat protein